MIKKNYIYIILIVVAFTFSSCNDIVNYNDGYDNQLSSNGPPTITMISKASDLKTPIEEIQLAEMIAIQGDNLTGLKSIKLNDVEIDLATVYAVRTRITFPVPLIVPNEFTDLITITTERGTVTYPLAIDIPDLVVDGFYNEFANSGDTVLLTGKYFDAYQLNLEKGVFKVNEELITPIKATSDSILFLMPTSIQDNVLFSMSSPKQSTPINLTFREKGISILDMNNLVSEYLTDGTHAEDPTALIQYENFIRVKGTIVAWDWKNVFWSDFNLTDADVIANPQSYYVKFEINTKSFASISTGNIIMGGSGNTFKWNPGENGALNTYSNWHTIKLELIDLYSDGNGGTYLVNGTNVFSMSYQPETEVNADFSMTNFRIVKK